VHASKQDIQNVTQNTIKKAIARESQNPLKQTSQTNRGHSKGFVSDKEVPYFDISIFQ